MMRFYTKQHPFYCGIDLHTRTMHTCILDHDGSIVLDRNLPCKPRAFLDAIAPYREGIIVGAECMFGWYWLADLCHEQPQPISFVLGHALYMKAIHGGKAKNDRIDANKIARLLRGGNFPLAYVYPQGMRETRDLLRRRMYLVHKRAELMTHLQILNSQYNLPPFPKKLSFAANRAEMKIDQRFSDPSVQKSAAPTSRRARSWARAARRSATPICVGLWARRSAFSCVPVNAPRSGKSGRRVSAAKARRWASWLPSSAGRFTTCSARK